MQIKSSQFYPEKNTLKSTQKLPQSQAIYIHFANTYRQDQSLAPQQFNPLQMTTQELTNADADPCLTNELKSQAYSIPSIPQQPPITPPPQQKLQNNCSIILPSHQDNTYQVIFNYRQGSQFRGTATGPATLQIQLISGTLSYPNGDYYQGTFMGNQPHGDNCVFVRKETGQRFEGGFREGKLHGRVRVVEGGEGGVVREECWYERGVRVSYSGGNQGNGGITGIATIGLKPNELHLLVKMKNDRPGICKNVEIREQINKS